MHLSILRVTLPDGRSVFMWTLFDAAGTPRAMQCGASDSAEHCRTDALSLLCAGHHAIDTGHGLPWSVTTAEEHLLYFTSATLAAVDNLMATLPTAIA